jgi:hypothetical protein
MSSVTTTPTYRPTHRLESICLRPATMLRFSSRHFAICGGGL